MKRILLAAAALCMAAVVPHARAASPPTKDLKALAFAEKAAEAKSLFESSVPRGRQLGAEWLEAMSWVARAGAIGGDWNQAADYSERTLLGCESLLEGRPLGADPQAPLPIALGAAIETMGKFYVAMEDRGQAVAFLREHLGKYAGTSIETRLNKNLLALDLAGKPMPALDTGRWLNESRFDASALRGKVTLFFFWAHWCSDCNEQKPVLLDLERKYGSRGLRVVAPTRLYGYVVRGTDADPATELEYIEESHVGRHPLLGSVPVPLSGENFVSFGVSTTPTLVLVDREGVVRLYHPGQMERGDLEEQIEALL